MNLLPHVTWITLVLSLVTAKPGMADAVQPAGDEGAYRYDDHKIVTLNVETQRELRTLFGIGAQPMACRVGPGKGQYILSAEQIDAVRQVGMDPVTEVKNVQAMIDLERGLNERAKLIAGDDEWFAAYRTWNEVNDYIDELVDLRPDLVEKILLGQSYEGRNIYGMRITGPGENKPAVLFNGCQHAREWISVMVPMYIADKLVRDYDTDSTIQELVDRVEFLVVPIVNPDGYEYTYEDDGDRMWRKNRTPNPASPCLGTDLNRNWDVDWNGGHSTTTDPCSDIYVGAEAMSEPETQAMAAFIQDHPQIVAHVDYHNFSELILQPLGFPTIATPDQDAIDELGSAMRDAILEVHGKDYPNGTPCELLYCASGIMPDWLYLEQGGVFGYTIELRPDSFWPGFLLPPEEIVPTAEENFPAAMLMAEWAANGVMFTFPEGLPEEVEAGIPVTLLVEINSIMSGTVDPDSATLFVDTDGDGIFVEHKMTHLGGADYETTLPAGKCDQTIEYYFEVATNTGPIYTSPSEAYVSPYSTSVVALDEEGNIIDCPLPTCPEDLTSDGIVDVFDLLQLIDAWGPCEDCPEDLNADGVVDVFDLLQLIGAWGQCPDA